MLIYAFLIPIVAELPTLQAGAFLYEVDLTDFRAPLRPDTDVLVIAARDVAVRLNFDRSDLIDSGPVSFHDLLLDHALSGNK